MPSSRDRELAVLLARVLDGKEPPRGEAGALAMVLERAAEGARLELTAEEVERALEAARPSERRTPRRPALRLGLGLAGVAAAVAAAVVLVVLSPFSKAPGVDVAAQAASALGGRDTVLAVVELVKPADPDTFEESERVGWLDLAAGRARWTQRVEGRIVAETLVEPGSIRHYLPESNTVIAASSCGELAAGCADAVDPVAFYREALATAREPAVAEVTFRGRPAYRLVLPVQALPDAARIEQVVFVDADTYLPLRIEWRDVPEAGEPHPFAVIDVESIRLVPREAAPDDAFALEVPAGATVLERGEAGRVLEVRALTLEEARQVSPPLLWLGRTYSHLALDEIVEIRLEGGTVYRLGYAEGSLVIWNYTTVVPPEIKARTGGTAKVVPVEGGGVARFYRGPDGIVVGEREAADRSVAVVAPELGKVDVFGALQELRALE